MRLFVIAATALAVAVSVPPTSAQEASRDVIIAEAFELAMTDLVSGRPDLAIPLLRGILARDPDLSRVRLELARAYFEAGRFGSAREQFRIVLSDPELPIVVRENVLRFLRRTDEERGWRTSFGFSLITPTGSGRQYDTDTVILDLFGTSLPFELKRPEVPDIAVRLEGSVQRQWSVSEFGKNGRSSAFIRGNAVLEEAEGSTADKQEAELGAGLRLTWPRRTMSAELFSSAFGFSNELFETRIGVNVTYETRNTSGQSLFFAASFSDVDAKDIEARSGELLNFRTGVASTFGARSSLSFLIGVQLRDAVRNDFGYSSAEALLAHQVDIEGGISLTTAIRFEVFEQDERTPGFTENRVETERGINMRIEKNDFFIAGRFTPYLEVGYARRESSIDAFSYDETRLGLGVSTAF